MKELKIVSLNTDHTNANYVNCLKNAVLLLAKEEADILAFHEVCFGCYGFITNYNLFKDFNSVLDNSTKTNKPYGELLISRQNFRDSHFHISNNDALMIYFYPDYTIAISRSLDLNASFLRSFKLPNGNIKPTILINPEKIYVITTDKIIPVEHISKNEPTASKYPLNIAIVNIEQYYEKNK